MSKLITILLAGALAVTLVGCSDETPVSQEEKIRQAVSAVVHPLTAEEMVLAQANAKQFFNETYPVLDNKGEIVQRKGAFIMCRNSDSNNNGLVTCRGKLPKDNGTFTDSEMYCGYNGTMLGCNDKDTNTTTAQ